MVPTYYVAKYARQHVTVVLNGDGGDELFGGYSRPVVARAAAPYKKLVPAGIRRSVGDWFSGTQNPMLRKASLLARAGQYDGYRGFLYDRGFQEYRDLMYTDAFRAETASLAPSEYYRAVWEQADGCDDVDRVLCLDFKTYLPDQLLTKMDVSTMAHSVEARSPLLSKELIEFAALIPASLRLRGYNTKYLLKKLAARYVPREIVYRKKRGFVMPISGMAARRTGRKHARGVAEPVFCGTRLDSSGLRESHDRRARQRATQLERAAVDAVCSGTVGAYGAG